MYKADKNGVLFIINGFNRVVYIKLTENDVWVSQNNLTVRLKHCTLLKEMTANELILELI